MKKKSIISLKFKSQYSKVTECDSTIKGQKLSCENFFGPVDCSLCSKTKAVKKVDGSENNQKAVSESSPESELPVNASQQSGGSKVIVLVVLAVLM